MIMMRYVKVGLFFILLGAAGTVYMVMSSDGFSRFNTQDYKVLMDDATGLAVNSKVYLAGVPVGKIRRIDLSGGQALVTVAFLRDIPIRSDSRISRRSSSLLGTSILTLSPGTGTTPLIAPGGRIETQTNIADMESLTNNVQELTLRLSKLLDSSLGSFTSIVRKIDERSDAELDRVTRILEATASITERLDLILKERNYDLNESAIELRLALENIRAITEALREGRGTIGQALTNDTVYENLQQTIESMNKLVKDTDTIVAKASDIGVQVDAAGRYDMRAENMRANASLRLEPPSGDRWYRIGIGTAPDGIVSQKTTETRAAGSPTVRTETNETTSGVTVDAEVARRIGMFTLRGGLLDSTAGFGLDFSPVTNFTVSGELFDFRADARPNLRGTLTVYPFFDPGSGIPLKWLYFRAGLTSALDANRDYFIGAGMRFAN